MYSKILYTPTRTSTIHCVQYMYVANLTSVVSLLLLMYSSTNKSTSTRTTIQFKVWSKVSGQYTVNYIIKHFDVTMMRVTVITRLRIKAYL